MTFPETEQESFFVLLNVDIHVIAYKVTHLFVQSGNILSPGVRPGVCTASFFMRSAYLKKESRRYS